MLTVKMDSMKRLLHLSARKLLSIIVTVAIKIKRLETNFRLSTNKINVEK